MLLGAILALAAWTQEETDLERWGRAVEEVAARLRRSVVTVSAERAGGPRGAWSGIVVRDGGIVATDGSGLREADRIIVTDFAGAAHEARLAGVDRLTGVGIVRVEGLDIPPIEFHDRPPREHEMILVCGNALGTPGSTFLGFAAGGRLQARIGERVVDDLVGICVPAFPGDAGAGVADLRGRLLGIVIASHRGESPSAEPPGRILDMLGLVERSGAGAALVLPADVLGLIVEDIAEHGRVQRGRMGMAVRAAESGEIVVTEVELNGPAMRAPLYPRDVIQAVDGAAVSDPRELRRIVWRAVGRTLRIRILRDGEVREVDVAVEADRSGDE